jgi:hypothetical protein
MRRSLGANRLTSANKQLLTVSIMAMATWGGCQYDPYHYTYLKYVPPRAEICGTWVIDPERTSWEAAKPLLERKEIGPHRGSLEIRADGSFVIIDLPDFSKEHTGPIVPPHSASGKWWTATDSEGPYLWLDFKALDGKPTDDRCASAYFRHEGGNYLLHVIIEDPDTGDALVLKKREKQVEPDSITRQGRP